MTLNDPYFPVSRSRQFWRWIYQKRYEIHSFNEILIVTFARPTQQCYFEWPWVILSDLAKYSMTRILARSLCDSWASCSYTPLHLTPPLGESPSDCCHTVWYAKTNGVATRRCIKRLRMCITVSTESRRVTDGTDRQTSCDGTVRAMHCSVW